MRLYLFYTMMQKSQKWPKTQIKGGGSCLNPIPTRRGGGGDIVPPPPQGTLPQISQERLELRTWNFLTI